MSRFDTVAIVDWSAAATPSPRKPSADAIWMAVAQGGIVSCTYHRTRSDVMAELTNLFDAELLAGRRVLAGFDFPFGYPAGFAEAVTGHADPLILWEALASCISDERNNANNRFKVAGALNQRFPGIGPFWGRPANQEVADLPQGGLERHGHGMTERRQVEEKIRSAQPCWKLYTTGSVGSQALMGIARLQPLRTRYGEALSVSPFQTPETPIVLAEVYPSYLSDEISARQEPDEITDRAQVRVMAQAFAGLPEQTLDRMLREGHVEEGWILGYGYKDALTEVLEKEAVSSRLRSDCFSLPPGVHWTSVDEALADLKSRLEVVVAQKTLRVGQALNRILATDVIAPRSHPPQANTAVDGYGFANGRPSGSYQMMLHSQHVAAGHVLDAAVPAGTAVRILTGAALPPGVDTVILQEDSQIENSVLSFDGPVRQGANTRAAGEDVKVGDVILSAGRCLTPADLALMSAVGVADVSVHKKLRVAIISTGDELVEPGKQAGIGQIYDANRPMLAGLIAQLGHEPVDLGRVADDRDALRALLDHAAPHADVILTSGGASAGDADHVSALLNESGAMALWRIAIKPGRPLALGVWQGCPVFGLPGNPVAAMVCTLVFASPAFARLAGAEWPTPQGFDVPAAFEKRKKAGRREYLRARMRDGQVEVFASEGSGRISGLSWADGLVELPDRALHIRRGDMVRFIPWGGFGL